MSDGTTLTLRNFTAGEDVEVAVGRIDAELDRLWREIARRAQRTDGDTAPVHRACLFNLVVHAGDAEAEVVARFLAGTLTGRLPSRVVLLRARPDEPDAGPRAWVASIADPATSHGGARVSGELVVLAAAGARVGHLPALVRSALEPDMPTTLWWAGPLPPPAHHVTELCGTADRIVVDSDAFVGGAGCAHVLACADPSRLADLAWPRQRPWRTAIARAFDAPSARPFLDTLHAVEIGVGSGGAGGAARASGGPLLAGWLAASLGWATCVGTGTQAVCFPGAAGGSRRLEVQITQRATDAAGVVHVKLSGAEGEVHFERRDDPPRVEVRVPRGFAAVSPAPFREREASDVLADALLAVHADPIAPEAIRRAAEIAPALGATT